MRKKRKMSEEELQKRKAEKKRLKELRAHTQGSPWDYPNELL